MEFIIDINISAKFQLNFSETWHLEIRLLLILCFFSTTLGIFPKKQNKQIEALCVNWTLLVLPAINMASTGFTCRPLVVNIVYFFKWPWLHWTYLFIFFLCLIGVAFSCCFLRRASRAGWARRRPRGAGTGRDPRQERDRRATWSGRNAWLQRDPRHPRIARHERHGRYVPSIQPPSRINYNNLLLVLNFGNWQFSLFSGKTKIWQKGAAN